MSLRDDLIRDEGRKSHPYKCTAGKTTIGVQILGVPRLPQRDPANCLLGDAVFPAQLGVQTARSRDRSDAGNLGVRQRGLVVLFSKLYRRFARCSVALGVERIRYVRVPPEIRQGVVRGVAIVMAALSAFRPWPNKGQKHKPVDTARLCAAVNPQIDRQTKRPATLSPKVWFEYLWRINRNAAARAWLGVPTRTNAAKVAGLIEPIPGNWSPVFGGGLFHVAA